METIEKMQCQICTLYDKFKEQQEEGIVSSIVSPNNTITIGGDGSIVTVDIEESLLNLINESIQPGDNVSELVNDAGYAILADLHPVATSGSYNDLEDVPTSFPPSAHTHPISDIINLQSTLDSKENLANKGLPNGYAGLDAGGKIPSSQLPNSVMELQGEWNALTNTPTLIDGIGNPGDIWKVTTAGTQNLGSGNITFEINDFATYGSNGIWFKSDNTDAVNSVFGRIGTVVAQANDYTASQVTNVPSGNISSITVQDALNELDIEKAIDANVVHKTGFETISGQKEFSTTTFFTGTYSAQFNGFVSFLTANSLSANTYSTGSIGTLGSKLAISGGSNGGRAVLSTNLIGVTARTFDFPNQSGTFALTSDLAPYALDANVVHKTGNESITGVKSFGADGIIINNSNTAVIGIAISNSGVGIRIVSNNNANSFVAENVNGRGLWVNTTGTVGTAIGIVSNMSTTATGLTYAGQNNGVNTFTVDKLGTVAGTSFIKSGATASNILLAGGFDIPQSTFVPSTRTISINGVTQDLSADRSYRAGLSNTGVLTYGGINVGSSTTVNIGAVTGVITDNETTPGTPSYQLVTYAGATNITVPTIGSGTGTYVLLNSSGTIVFQNTFPTSAQRKSMIYLSKISHPNLATISFAIDEPDFVNSPLQQFRDLFQAIQYMNQGVVATGNSGLTINTTNGNIIGDGINFVLDKTNPNMLTVAAGAPRNFLLLNQSGATGSFVTTIDPTNYDVGGTTTLIGGGTNRTTIQYLYYAPGVGFAIQRGQTVYPSLLDAVSAVGRESFIVRPNLVNNSILIAAIVLRHTTTAMNDTNFVRILSADKFGQLGGASSGISVTSLQTAYNNSLIPQITTTSALGAFTLRNGGTLDTDNVFAIQNIAGTTTAGINGNGAFTGTSWNGYTPANDANVLHTTGTEIFSGSKMAVNAGSTGTTNGFVLSNNGTGDSTSLKISNNSTGIGSFYTNGNGIASKYESSTGTTGDLIQFTKNLVLTSRIDHNGRYIVSGSPATNILLAGGTDIPQSTFALASGSGNYIQNQNASAQSANMWINGNAGIGTVTPSSAPGYGYLTIGSTNGGIVETSNGTTKSVFQTTINGGYIGTITNNNFEILTNGSSKVIVLPSGNVGIGTTNPLNRTHILGGTFVVGNEATYAARFGGSFDNRGVVIGYDDANSKGYIGSIRSDLAWTDLILNINGGNIGVGNDNPSSKLDTTGDLTLRGIASNGTNIIKLGTYVANGLYGSYISTDHNYSTTTDTNLKFGVTNGGSPLEVMRLLTNGNVGIGTTNPITRLNVDKSSQSIGTTNPSGGFLLSDVGGTSYSLEAGINVGSGPWIQSRSYANATMYQLAINPSGGNVMIGTTTDNGVDRLQVAGKISTEEITSNLFNFRSDNFKTANASVGKFSTFTGGGSDFELIFNRSAAGAGSYYGIQSVEQAVGYRNIALNQDGGNVLIGTTTDNGVDKLQVSGSGYFSSTLKVGSFEIIPSATNGTNIIGVTGSSNDLVLHNGLGQGFFENPTGTQNAVFKGNVKIEGLIGTGTRTVVADASGNLSAPVSDESLKENIQPIHYGLNEIMKMNPVSYNFKDKEKYGEGTYLGNIAQDMEKVIPEAVFTDTNTGKMGIEYSHLHAVYIKAIQELLIRIEKLENR